MASKSWKSYSDEKLEDRRAAIEQEQQDLMREVDNVRKELRKFAEEQTELAQEFTNRGLAWR